MTCRLFPWPRGGTRGIIKEARARLNAVVFLSHSHFDEDRLARVIQLLETAGATVYVDDLDPASNSLSRHEIAEHLRGWIRKSSRLVVVGTSNLSTSRWIPWELGYADGVKGLANVALLPLDVSAVQAASIEQEYLLTYPTIRVNDKNAIPATSDWCVVDPRDGRSWVLGTWINAQRLV